MTPNKITIILSSWLLIMIVYFSFRQLFKNKKYDKLMDITMHIFIIGVLILGILIL
jgi:hypothetical protein